jgi:hypothetical protein
MSETIVIPWYATGFRGDAFETALNRVAAAAMRYNASSYAVYRSSDDLYRFQQFAEFVDHHDWVRYWEGPEMVHFRATHSGWYQIPVLYGSWQCTASGRLDPAALALVAANGGHNDDVAAAHNGGDATESAEAAADGDSDAGDTQAA